MSHDATAAHWPSWVEKIRGADHRMGEGIIPFHSAMGQAVRDNRISTPGRPSKPAAVLVLFSGHTLAQAQVLLTHRSPTMRSHSGQIAFPGGRMDPKENPVQTALREANEETGLLPASVSIMEQWEPLTIRYSGSPVTPVLGHWAVPGPLHVASPEETDDVFLAPVADLLDPTNRLMVSMRHWKGPAFWYNGYLIWGFTSGVLSTLFRHAGWERNWDRHSVWDLDKVLPRSRNNESRKF